MDHNKARLLKIKSTLICKSHNFIEEKQAKYEKFRVRQRFIKTNLKQRQEKQTGENEVEDKRIQFYQDTFDKTNPKVTLSLSKYLKISISHI